MTGVRWGEPFVYHPDEGLIAHSAMAMVANGDWNPHMFLYPSLLIDLEAVIVGVGHRLLGWPLGVAQPGLFATEALPSQFGAFLAGRMLMATLGSLTILTTYMLGRRLGGRVAGLLAASVIAVAPVHLESSRYLTTDVLVTLLCTLAVLAAIRALDQPTFMRWWFVSAALVGLAASAKWNGAVVGVIPAALFVSRGRTRDELFNLARSRSTWLLVATAPIALVATTPAILFAPTEVAHWLTIQSGAYTSQSYAALRGAQEANGILVAFGSIVQGSTVMTVGAALAAVVALALSGRRIDLAISAFLVLYTIVLALPVLYFPRNALPALPFVALAIGLFPSSARSRLERVRFLRWPRPPSRLPVAAWSAVVLIGLLPALVAGAVDARRLSRPDTRSIAYTWILEHIPPNARVAREQYTPQVPALRYLLRNHDGLYQRSISWYAEQRVQYLVASSVIDNRFVDSAAFPYRDLFYQALFGMPEIFRIDARPDRPGPTIRIFRLVAPTQAGAAGDP